MKGKITISEEFRDYIQELLYEKSSRADMLCFMLSAGMSNDTMLKKLQNEHLEFYVQFEEAKKTLEELYLGHISNKSSWSLDFYSCEVTYETN